MTLSLLVWLPAVGAGFLYALPRITPRAIRAASLLFAGAELLLALWAFLSCGAGAGGQAFVEARPWIPSWGVSYLLGMDALSGALVLLTALLSFLALVATLPRIREGLRAYGALFLVLESGAVGVFLARDLFLFYVFWEAALVPMTFLIYLFGHEDRRRAAVKFFLYTMAGSLLLFFAILWLGVRHGTFDLGELARRAAAGGEEGTAAFLLFGAFFAAFAVKVPMFPFHTWLPDAHTEAPTGGSVILAGVLLKMGGYGFLRIALPLAPAPARALAPFLAALAVVGVVYGALMALAQTDIKRLIAYSSVSHMGFVMLGIFSGTAEGFSGAAFQMVSHGISTGALFLVVGALYDRRRTHAMDAYGGLAARAPVLMTLFLVTALSSIGLPGLNGFVGEFLVLLGAFTPEARAGFPLLPWFGAAAATGIVLGAVYLLRLYERVAFGGEGGGEAGHGAPPPLSADHQAFVEEAVRRGRATEEEIEAVLHDDEGGSGDGEAVRRALRERGVEMAGGGMGNAGSRRAAGQEGVREFPDATAAERAALLPLALLAVVLGLFPGATLLDRLAAATTDDGRRTPPIRNPQSAMEKTTDDRPQSKI